MSREETLIELSRLMNIDIKVLRKKSKNMETHTIRRMLKLKQNTLKLMSF